MSMSTVNWPKLSRAKVGRTRFAAALMVISAVIAGCGGSNSGSTSAAPQSSNGVDTSASLYKQLPAAIRQRGSIMETLLSHPPYQIVQPNGHITGVTVDLETAMSKYLGVPFKRVASSGDLAAVLGSISSGRADLYAGPITDTPERQAEFDFVNWLTGGSSFVAKTGTFPGKVAGTDMCGKNVAYAAGSPVVAQSVEDFSTWCTKQGQKPLQLSQVTNTNDLLLALDSGRADVVHEASDQAAFLAHTQSSKYHIITTTEAQGYHPLTEGYVISKSSGLAPVLLKALQEMERDGSYKKILGNAGLSNFAMTPSMNVA